MNGAVLALYGSPKTGGFSSKIHDALLEPLKDAGVNVTGFNPYYGKVLPCNACYFCRGNERCVNHDDMAGIYETLMSCSLVTVSSPVYFSGIASPLKALIDRCQFIWERREFVKAKAAFFIAVSGSVYSGAFDGMRVTVRHFFNTLNASFDENEFIFLEGSDSMSKVPEEALRKAAGIGGRYLPALLGMDGK